MERLYVHQNVPIYFETGARARSGSSQLLLCTRTHTTPKQMLTQVLLSIKRYCHTHSK